MEPPPRPHLLLHPAVIPARWLEIADVLADMDEGERKRWLEGLRNKVWAAGWLDMEQTPQPRVLGSEPKPKDKPFIWDEDCLVINEVIKVARYREMIGDTGPVDRIEIVVTRSMRNDAT